MSDVPSDRPGSSATFPEECRRFLRNSRSGRELLSLIVSSSSSNKVSNPLPRLKPQMLTQRQSERWFPQGFGCFFIIKGHPCPPIQSHNWEDPTFKGEQEWREADVLLFGSEEPAHDAQSLTAEHRQERHSIIQLRAHPSTAGWLRSNHRPQQSHRQPAKNPPPVRVDGWDKSWGSSWGVPYQPQHSDKNSDAIKTQAGALCAAQGGSAPPIWKFLLRPSKWPAASREIQTRKGKLWDEWRGFIAFAMKDYCNL